MAEVQHLFVCLVHRFPMKELAEAEAIENIRVLRAVFTAGRRVIVKCC